MLEGTRQNDIGDSAPSDSYRNYVLFMLLMVGIFAWIDRQIFAMLMQSIKEDLLLTDTQLGILGGMAFGVIYVIVGLPMAWLSDRYSRRNIISLSLALWSGMTALCGAATGYGSLFMARMGVGVGEAGGSPPAQSLLSDYFPAEKRGFALSVYFLYIPLGFFAGYLLGGWINEFSSWRSAFMIVGLPGVVLAIIVRLTVRDVPRGQSDHTETSNNSGSMISTVIDLLRCKSLRNLTLAGAIHSIGAFAVSVWAPTYFMRAHDLSSGMVGTWMAISYGIGGSLGILIGGKLADRFFQKNR